jgi:hypothetical protein
MAKDTKSVRFSDKALEHINNYPTSYHGSTDFTSKIEEIVEASRALIELTKRELKGFFTTEEACLMVDVNNSHLYVPNYPKSALHLCVHDGNLYEELGEKWSVDIQVLLDKINKLSNYQCHCVFLMCNEFWNILDEERSKKTIQETVNSIFSIS